MHNNRVPINYGQVVKVVVEANLIASLINHSPNSYNIQKQDNLTLFHFGSNLLNAYTDVYEQICSRKSNRNDMNIKETFVNTSDINTF